MSFAQSQDSKEWLDWRQNGIGASDISVIMGLNPYKTPFQLWEEKCGFGKEKKLSNAIKHGMINEDIARQWLNKNLSVRLIPVCIEHPTEPLFRASLDGYDELQNIIIEIKCPISESIIFNARSLHAFPDYWIMQVQWQLMVSNLNKGILALWDYKNENCILMEIYPDQTLFKKMQAKAREFWKGVQLGKPPELGNDEYKEMEDVEALESLMKWKEYSDQEAFFKKEKEKLKEKILTQVEGGNVKIKNFYIRFNPPKYSYNIEQMKLDGIEVDKYKKNGESGFYTINYRKN